MYPIICQIGPMAIYSYGLMLAIAAVVCAALLSRDAKSYQIESSVIYDLVFWLVIGGIIGARLFYVALNAEEFLNHPLRIFMLQEGGIAWQGGFAGGLLAGWLFVRNRKLNLRLMLDLAAPYLALGQAIGRIGCFLNGCCYGRPWDQGVYFPVHDDHLHPTQLYDSAGLLIIFLLLKSAQKQKFPRGKVFIFYLVGAASLRFLVEFFRADHENLYFYLSIYQWVCIVILGFALYVHTRFKS